MKITQLLSAITTNDFDFDVFGLSLNTQTLQTGDIFIAIQGANNHGTKFINQAIEKGCVGVLTDLDNFKCDVPSIYIKNLGEQLPNLANQFYPQAKKVEIIGITGTNGKTSVASFIAQMLDKLGVKNGLIGTLGITHNSQISTHTTPDIFTLYRALDEYQCHNINTVVLEISSHALAQNRIAGLTITHAILTNITQDHLDYHPSFEQYQREKLKLFQLNSLKSVVLNLDDKNVADFQQISKNIPHFDYSIADFKTLKTNEYGFIVQLEKFVFEVALLGEFNLSNILAAFNTLKSLGFSAAQIIPLLSELNAPAGRMQKIQNQLAWVDYAHTPDALEKAITTLQTHYPEHNIRLIFGCGGERDQTKRAQMGKIASTFATTIILTDDNPRSENPRKIIDDILSGIDDSFEVDIIQDRTLAIQTGMTTLKENECLLIAGKGHESQQIYKDKNIAMNDIDIANNA
jgi:UDP-N-acetylmuramoyl-L-alanyl-D-glutamate--2,6-diaminopimelate ligase